MRILAFTDVHADFNLVEKLVARAKKNDIDLILTAGDYSTFGKGSTQVLDALNSVGKPIVLIPGNHESAQEAKQAEKDYEHIHNIHCQTWEYKGVVFMGHGTGGFAKRDAEFVRVSKHWPNTGKRVLVTHGPPHGTKLDALHGDSVGNKDYTEYIKRAQPTLYICGHLHENAEVTDQLGKTIMINPGWEGKVLEIQ